LLKCDAAWIEDFRDGLAYLASCYAAAVTLSFLIELERMHRADLTILLLPVSAVFLVPFVIVVTVLPWLFCMLFAHRYEIRNYFVYIAAGILLGSILPFIAGVVFEPMMLAFLFSGFVGGTVYWIIAGRTLGLQR
jgi:hypothetical protein